jgi:hypothetical protein
MKGSQDTRSDTNHGTLSDGLERRAVGEGAVDLRTLDDDVAHAALIDLGQELREGDVLGGGALAGVLEEREQRQQQQDDDHPQGEIAKIGVHLGVLTRRADPARGRTRL